jgi:signal transduction histidine kinase
MLTGQLLLLLFIPVAHPPLPPRFENILLAGGLWLAGSAVRDRRAHAEAQRARAEAMEERAARMERERELAARMAIVEERGRIARELHDVVAHSVSVMVVQSGAARRLLERRPARAAEALQSVESSGREALTELRRLLGLLTEAVEADLSPQPGLGQLDALVERVGAAGLRVEVRTEGAPRPLPAGLDLTAYRVVQEALTNVLKHASGAPTRVVVRYLDEVLELEVLDEGGRAVPGADGGGRGLAGMRERVAMYGGRLEAEPRSGGGFAVRARLPLVPA